MGKPKAAVNEPAPKPVQQPTKPKGAKVARKALVDREPAGPASKPKPRKSEATRRGPGRPIFDASVEALGHRAGWDTSRGLYIEKANAFIQRSKKSRPMSNVSRIGHDAIDRGKNPFVKSFGGQRANEFGQFDPKKDTIEPFDEFIGTVQGSAGFDVTTFTINPGNAVTFPQLSQVASLYERYNFANLEFYVCPLVTVITATGKIALSADLEGVEEGPPTSMSMVENNSIHSDGMPFEYFSIQCAGVIRHQESWFVNSTNGYPGGADPRLYDAGTLYVSSSGNPVSSMCELRVRGIVELYDKMQEPTASSVPTGTSSSQVIGTQTLTNGIYLAMEQRYLSTGTLGYPVPWGWSKWLFGNTSCTCPRLGWYTFNAEVQVQNGGSNINYSGLQLRVDGAIKYEKQMKTGGAVDYIGLSLDLTLQVATGSIVEVFVRADFGAGTTTVVAGSLTITSL